jgi:hypothetical protein
VRRQLHAIEDRTETAPKALELGRDERGSGLGHTLLALRELAAELQILDTRARPAEIVETGIGTEIRVDEAEELAGARVLGEIHLLDRALVLLHDALGGGGRILDRHAEVETIGRDHLESDAVGAQQLLGSERRAGLHDRVGEPLLLGRNDVDGLCAAQRRLLQADVDRVLFRLVVRRDGLDALEGRHCALVELLQLLLRERRRRLDQRRLAVGGELRLRQEPLAGSRRRRRNDHAREHCEHPCDHHRCASSGAAASVQCAVQAPLRAARPRNCAHGRRTRHVRGARRGRISRSRRFADGHGRRPTCHCARRLAFGAHGGRACVRAAP